MKPNASVPSERTAGAARRIDYTKISPSGVQALGMVYAYVLQCGLDAQLIELVYLRVSQINGCAYCIDLHTRNLVARGVPFEKLALLQVWRDAGPVFTARERAALGWGEIVSLVADTGVPDPAFEAISTEFPAKVLVDLTIAISLMNAYNRLAVSFRRPPAAALAAEN